MLEKYSSASPKPFTGTERTVFFASSSTKPWSQAKVSEDQPSGRFSMPETEPSSSVTAFSSYFVKSASERSTVNAILSTDSSTSLDTSTGAEPPLVLSSSSSFLQPAKINANAASPSTASAASFFVFFIKDLLYFRAMCALC